MCCSTLDGERNYWTGQGFRRHHFKFQWNHAGDSRTAERIMTDQPKRSRFAPDSIAAPLRHAVFRRIWLASLVSNLGILIQGVGAAWAMTQMTSSADKVALVQTALMLPVMLISMPAGAIAGIVVATAGAVAAVAVNAALYLPLMVVLFLWNRASEPSRLPRERLNRAMVSGVRYITNSPSIKIVLTRTLVTGIIGGSVSALMPLVARDLLHGGAQTYGIMLGAFGMGAVFGALNIGEVRRRMSGEAAVRACAISMAGAIAAVALSTNAILTAVALVIAGAAWMLAVALFNIGVQLSAPRWVAGRSLAAFQASIAGGIAVGSWGWGHLTDYAGVEVALLVAAGLMLIS